jgi:hypothetical protein
MLSISASSPLPGIRHIDSPQALADILVFCTGRGPRAIRDPNFAGIALIW